MNMLRVVLVLTALAFPLRAETVAERLGHPADARLLIIHADDLGMCHSVNRATFEALQRGWVTSASAMVPTPWFAEVAQFARANPRADIGIHLTLNSEWTTLRWGPVSGRSEVPSLLDAEGYLHSVEDPVLAGGRPEEVERELRAQIARARALGLQPTHLDSHMAVLFGSPAFFDVYRGVAQSEKLPYLLERQGMRGGAAREWAPPATDALIDRVLGIPQGVPISGWAEAYESLLAKLQPGVYQLIVHLAYSDDEMRAATRDHPDWGAAWRQADLDLVSSERFRKFLADQKFVLVSWRDLAKARRRE